MKLRSISGGQGEAESIQSIVVQFDAHLNIFMFFFPFQGPSASAYVTYFKSEDALRAIQVIISLCLCFEFLIEIIYSRSLKREAFYQ